MSMFGISNEEAVGLVRLSNAPITDELWRPYLQAVEQSLGPLDPERYPGGITHELMMLGGDK